MHDRTHPRRGWRALAVLAAIATAPLALPSAASAGRAGPAEEHCAVEVVELKKDGEAVLGEMTCFDTQAQALASLGVGGDTAASRGAAARLSNIAIHFDGFNATGSSLAVAGTTCGTWHNLNITWWNRISSTQSNCWVAPYDLLLLQGDFQAIPPPGGNLTTLNNRSESIEYV